MSDTHLEVFPFNQQIIVERQCVEDLPCVETQEDEENLDEGLRLSGDNRGIRPVDHDVWTALLSAPSA